MSFGFIHGVMNTDNMAVSGETIDYGPCAFIDAYHPDRVFSSIDRHGRYAYAQQPNVALWNLAQLASALLPLIGEGEVAIEVATAALDRFWPTFTEALNAALRPRSVLRHRGQVTPRWSNRCWRAWRSKAPISPGYFLALPAAPRATNLPIALPMMAGPRAGARALVRKPIPWR